MLGKGVLIGVMALAVTFAAVGPTQAAQATTGSAEIYRVQPGDTLWSVARRHGTTPEHLAALNGIATEGILSIGQRLKVPGLTGGPRATTPASGLPVEPRATIPLARGTGPSRGARWASTIVAVSNRLLGVRYRWGGMTPDGFDCSGFLNYVFGRTGVDLPRITYAMFEAGTPVARDDLQVGDIVFFETVQPGPSHAGIYLGDGRFAHSSSGAGRVTITPLDHRYYAPRYLGARRF